MPRRLSAPGVASRAENLSRSQPTPYGISPGFNGHGTSSGCQWIEGEDYVEVIRAGGDPHCGAGTVPGKTYCPEHQRLAFTRMRPALVRVRPPFGG